jgi:UPF0176 protein
MNNDTQNLAVNRYLTAALYKFVALPDFAALQAPLQHLCDANQVKGTLLLASEGINGTISSQDSGDGSGVRAVLAFLAADARFSGLNLKESWSAEPPFLRMKVRLKKEIVTLGVPGVSPTLMAGEYVKAENWNALINQGDVVLIDTRNDYEVAIGSFDGAINPAIKTFADFPAWVVAQEQPGGSLAAAYGKKPKVAMFCTGGIRCEKSTSLLRQHGFDEVFHLEGGILKYLENVPAQQSQWQGECFVFDERVSVGHGLQQGPYTLCRSCRRPVGDVERASDQYVKGVSCPACFDSRSNAEKQGLAERQRQVDLAQRRGLAHVGAKMPVKTKNHPRPLKDPSSHLLQLLASHPQQRVLIGLAGLPGSGKSTLATQLATEVNARAGAGTMMALGMDGFHLSKAQLAAFADPAAALLRRGAPWTFDAPAFLARVLALRGHNNPSGKAVTWPGFEHGTGDPVADQFTVPPQTKIVLIEGLYLLHHGDGWGDSPGWHGLFDERWFLDVGMKTAMQRLVLRHMSANGHSREVALQRLAVNDRLNAQIVQASRAAADFLVL